MLTIFAAIGILTVLFFVICGLVTASLQAFSRVRKHARIANSSATRGDAMANADATRLLSDGVRLMLQVLVERAEHERVPIPQEMKSEIQRWFDDCYRFLENKEPPAE